MPLIHQCPFSIFAMHYYCSCEADMFGKAQAVCAVMVHFTLKGMSASSAFSHRHSYMGASNTVVWQQAWSGFLFIKCLTLLKWNIYSSPIRNWFLLSAWLICLACFQYTRAPLYIKKTECVHSRPAYYVEGCVLVLLHYPWFFPIISLVFISEQKSAFQSISQRCTTTSLICRTSGLNHL